MALTLDAAYSRLTTLIDTVTDPEILKQELRNLASQVSVNEKRRPGKI